MAFSFLCLTFRALLRYFYFTIHIAKEELIKKVKAVLSVTTFSGQYITKKGLLKETKAALIVFVAFMVLIVGYDLNRVCSAAVNEVTGDIAYVTDDDDHSYDMYVYDKKGNFLWSKNFDSYKTPGDSADVFSENGYYYYYIFDGNKIIELDKDGQIISAKQDDDKTVYYEKNLSSTITCVGWDKSFQDFRYTLDETEYCYHKSNYFSLRFLGDHRKLSVKSPGCDEVVIWEN